MRVAVMCSDPRHPAFPYIAGWCDRRGFELATKVSELEGGDYLLLISCTEIINADVRARFGRVFVVHESALPQGRGWSPLAWQVLEGKRAIPITLLEAADKVDAGPIWGQTTIELQGHELADEIQRIVTKAKTDLFDAVARAEPGFAKRWADDSGNVQARAAPREQVGDATYYPRRTPADSRLDPAKSLADQFDLLRICEPRFPAFFELRGHTYEVTLKKVNR